MAAALNRRPALGPSPDPARRTREIVNLLCFALGRGQLCYTWLSVCKWEDLL
ncbi:hypothetical protein RR11_2962 [Ruegeria sp. R11]|nr:hypothetical protein RR11_2962 [Ruegeria sp. R11]